MQNSKDDKQVIPDKYLDEINSIFEDDKSKLEMLQKSLKAENMKESIKELPDELSEKIFSSFSDFVQKFDQDEHIKNLETSLPDLSNEIKLKRQELKELKK
jgi:hypothetical protein